MTAVMCVQDTMICSQKQSQVRRPSCGFTLAARPSKNLANLIGELGSVFSSIGLRRSSRLEYAPARLWPPRSCRRRRGSEASQVASGFRGGARALESTERQV